MPTVSKCLHEQFATNEDRFKQSQLFSSKFTVIWRKSIAVKMWGLCNFRSSDQHCDTQNIGRLLKVWMVDPIKLWQVEICQICRYLVVHAGSRWHKRVANETTFRCTIMREGPC